MSGIFDSSRDPPRRSIFDDDDSGDDGHETDPFLSRSKITANTSTIDSHPTPSSSSSPNVARLSSPTALQRDHFSSERPPSYETPIRPSAHQSRSSYDSPANDPWSSTPRTNGSVPVAVPNFPRQSSSIRAGIGGAERASYLLDADHIDIQKSDEKEGFMGFKHVNYTVASARRGTQVVRRYSDFSWSARVYGLVDDRLYDALIKRYPFRQIPIMPPKRLAVNGHYLSTETDFLERRRRGLTRFMNSIVRHPVLRDDDIVVAFITIPTELSIWRKSASIPLVEEFTDRELPLDLESRIPAELEDQLDRVRQNLTPAVNIYVRQCRILDRLRHRIRLTSIDYSRYANFLTQLSEDTDLCPVASCADCPSIDNGLRSVARGLDLVSGVLGDESRAYDEGILEDLKRQRDVLVAMKETFDRRDRLAGDNVPSLEKRITNNEIKIQTIQGKPDAANKADQITKLEEQIQKDRETIRQLLNRRIFIRECMMQELSFFHASQVFVGRIYQDWSTDLVKYSELQVEGWKNMKNEVERMPGEIV